MLGNAFIEDVQERMGQMDTQYLTGLKNFLQHNNKDTVTSVEPAVSATPKLSSLLHAHLLLFTVFIHPSSSWYKAYACPANCHIQKTRRSHKRE